MLSYGKGDGAVRMLTFDRAHQMLNPFWSVKRVLPALQYEGAKTKLIALFAAAKNLLFGQPVTAGIWVGTADAAVIAVISAVVGELDQTADVDICTVIDPAHSICSRKKIGRNRFILPVQKCDQFFFWQNVLLF